jgi:hypothetical protein
VSAEAPIGPERARYDASLSSFMAEETRATLWAAVDDVLSHGPLGDLADHATGLALGYVQSGKTTNIIGLAAGAADAGYRVIVAFLGSTNLLVDQNGKRIRDALIEGRRDYKWQEVTGLKGAKGAQKVSAELGRGRILFIPTIKHAGRIRDLASALAATDLSDSPVLVIDDEADQASLNTSVKQGAESSTYAAISELRAALGPHMYVQYTATPYAPLLLDLNDHLLPEFVTLLHPGPGYTGGREFFVEHAAKVIRPIPTSDEQVSKTLPQRLPESLESALANFLVGAAALLWRDEELEPVSLLVHSTQRNDVQERYHFLIHRLLRKWQASTDGAASFDDLETLLRDEYIRLDKAGAGLPDQVQLLPHLRRALRETTTWLVNSESAIKAIQWNASPVHILVGGNKLDRGFTVEGLTVTYMNRPASVQVDTLEQRARAFGYRGELLPYCQFFATPRTLKVLRETVFTEYDLRARLRDVLDQGGTVDDWARDVGLLLPNGTQPTRPAVIGALNRFNTAGDGWHSLRQPSLDDADREANATLVDVLGLLDAERRDYGRLGFRTLEIPLETVLDGLLRPWRLRSYSAGWRHDDIIDHLSRMDGELSVPVLLMDDQQDDPRVRKWDELGFVNLFQGRDGSAQPGGYLGDRSVPPTEDRPVAVQVHYVLPRAESKGPVYTLAIRLSDMHTARKASA